MAVSPHPDLHGPVAIVAGGLSHERAVSLLSGERIQRELQSVGVDAHVVDADQSLLASLRTGGYTAVIPTIHGDIGEDGTLQTVLEMAGVPFTGSSSKACRLAWDKTVGRTLTERAGLSSPPWVALTSSSFKELGSSEVVRFLVEDMSWPLVVKPNRGGSVLGVNGVETVDALVDALMQAFAYGETVLVESFTEGMDVSVAVLDVDGRPRAGVPVGLEYDRKDRFDFVARYDPARVQVNTPAELPEETLAALRTAAETAHEALGMRDLSRVDFLVAPDGEFVVLEVSAIPGMTATSLFPFSVQADGGSFSSVLVSLLQAAVARTQGSATS
jgi:D-alanine-D-alanine ligase